MTPVIRVDDEVMEKLMGKTVDFHLIFPSPNEVIRKILGLDIEPSPEQDNGKIEIQLPTIHTPRGFALIPIPKDKRHFLPGYKVYFELLTDTGKVTTRVTSAPKGTSIGDPNAGAYIQGNLRSWFDKHSELKDGTKLLIKALEPRKRYELSIIQSGF